MSAELQSLRKLSFKCPGVFPKMKMVAHQIVCLPEVCGTVGSPSGVG